MSELSGGGGGGGTAWTLGVALAIGSTAFVSFVVLFHRQHGLKFGRKSLTDFVISMWETIRHFRGMRATAKIMKDSRDKYGVPKVGDDYFNVDLITLDSSTKKKLSDYMKSGRYLVLNFEYNGLVSKYQKDVDFLTIYIFEAHPKEQWGLGKANGAYDISQPKTLEARCEVARTFVDDMGFNGEVVVDGMDNMGMHRYQGFPERHHVLLDGKFVSVGPQGPFFYDLNIVGKFLEEALGY